MKSESKAFNTWKKVRGLKIYTNSPIMRNFAVDNQGLKLKCHGSCEGGKHRSKRLPLGTNYTSV